MLARVAIHLAPRKLANAIGEHLNADPDILVHILPHTKAPWECIAGQNIDLLILGASNRFGPAPDLIAELSGLPDSPSLILISDSTDPEERAAFVAAGCDAVLDPDLSPSHYTEAVDTLLAKRVSLTEETTPERVVGQPRLRDFVSKSTAMQTFMEMVRRVAGSQSSLLILGETGVGKERLARAIHAEGPRAAKPFVAVNCGALNEHLLESEIFGHEQGAFTGATRSRRGCFELAHTGTLFLDELAEMPRHLQVKLLRAIQEREILRVGGETPIPVDVRIMAATNRKIQDEVATGRFREDLYYRLSVVTLTIPALRERTEDIPEIVESYIHYLRPRTGCNVYTIAPDALAALQQYDWPGNVRELINIVERAMLLCSGAEIRLRDLPLPLASATNGSAPEVDAIHAALPFYCANPDELFRLPLKDARKQVQAAFEAEYLHRLLTHTRGRVGDTAHLAGIEARSLYQKMKQYGFAKEDFRATRHSPD